MRKAKNKVTIDIMQRMQKSHSEQFAKKRLLSGHSTIISDIYIPVSQKKQPRHRKQARCFIHVLVRAATEIEKENEIE